MPCQKENYKCLGILGADSIKETEIKEKIRKEYLKRLKKTSWNQALQQKSYQRYKHLSSHPCKILRTILKIDKELRQIG